MKKFLNDRAKEKVSLDSQIANFVFMSHTTPLADGKTPAKKIFSYPLRTNISSLQKPEQPWTTSVKPQMSRDGVKVTKFEEGEEVESDARE